jgi:hypothetical protein
MDRTDILNVFRDNYRISEAANDCEFTTMIRLNELHVETGRARHIILGTVSRYTLTNILKQTSKHLRMCPMCNENDLTTKL